MYLNLDGFKVLQMSDNEVEGWYYTSATLNPPTVDVGERAYVRFNKNSNEFYFENEKGEVI